MSHSHSHSQGDNSHSHGQQGADHDYVEANRKHHNAEGHVAQHESALSSWAAEKVAATVLKSYSFDENTTSVLDFACGSGMVSRLLRDHAKKVVGVDLSSQLVDAFNAEVAKRGINKDEMYAVQRDALRDEEDELDGELFDVVLCSQAYHHIPDLDAITKSLSRRLKPNGSLLVIDLSSEGNFEHEKIVDDKSKFKDVVSHKHGFSNEGLRSLFEKTGRFSSVKIEPSHEAKFGEMRAVGGENNWAETVPLPDDSMIRWVIATGVRAAQ